MKIKAVTSFICLSLILQFYEITSYKFVRQHPIQKRSYIEHLITTGDGTVCKYIIKFAFTMAKYELAQLVAYLQNNMASITTGRNRSAIDTLLSATEDDNDVALGVIYDHMIKKRDVSDVLLSIVDSSRALSCKLIVKFIKAVVKYQFQQLLNYLTANVGNIIG